MSTVVVRECSINQCGTVLTIRAAVDNINAYEDVYIDSVLIDIDTNYTDNSPSTKAIKVFESNGPEYPRVYTDLVSNKCTQVMINNEESIVTKTPIGPKEITLYVDAETLGVSNFNENIFFIYIFTEGTPKLTDTDMCGIDEVKTMAIAVNLRPIYDRSMAYIKELGDSCHIPTGFIDRILRLKAFDLALKTGHFVEAIKQWHNLVENKPLVTPDFSGSTSSSSGCNCRNLWQYL